MQPGRLPPSGQTPLEVKNNTEKFKSKRLTFVKSQTTHPRRINILYMIHMQQKNKNNPFYAIQIYFIHFQILRNFKSKILSEI